MAWVRAAKAADVSVGEGKVVIVDGKELALFHTREGFRALDNACPHRGGPMGDGPLLDDKVIACPWHGWQFDVASGALLMNPDCRLKTYPVQRKGDEVWVDIG
jgi:nitrite reductase/ring-hydroxylating ferredoxin subunit